MAKPLEKQPMMNNVSPIRENINEYPKDTDDYLEDDTVSTSGWCCFQWNQNRDGENRYLLGDQQHRETWFVKKLKKLKEGSELLAGPKWKNFIRKIGKFFNNNNNNKKKKSTTLFQYDPQSYALNFDDGKEEDDHGLSLGFSSRFAPPLSAEERRSGL